MLLLVSAIAQATPAPRAYSQGDAASGPCDEVLSQLRVAAAHRVPLPVEDVELEDRRRQADPGADLLPASGPTTIVLITPACRAQASRDAASSVVATARAMLQKSEPGWIDFGRRILCAMQDPRSAHELKTWMNDDDHPGARAMCLAELATWPDMEQQRNMIFAGLVRRTDMFEWGVDPAIVAAATDFGTSELHDQLVPVLADAHVHHAVGYDRLHAAVCAHDEGMSATRARACATLPAQAEARWRPNGPQAWVRRSYLTVAYGGTVALTYAVRDREVSRGFATAAGALAGFDAGLAAIYFGGKAIGYPVNHREVGFEALMLAAAVAGGVLGGIGAHAITSPPGARAPVTAAGLAPWYIAAFEATFE